MGTIAIQKQKRKAEPAFPIMSFMSLCLKALCLYVFLSKTFMSFCPKKLGNYILFAPLLLTPRPCRGGAGVGSAFLTAYKIFHTPLSSSLISLTPPLSPPLQGRGNSAYCIFLNPIPFVGLHIVPQQKRKAEPAFPTISFMSLCPKNLCLYVQSPKVQKVRRARP